MVTLAGCLDCGGPKPKTKGRRWCDSCLRVRAEAGRSKHPRKFFIKHGGTGTPTYRAWTDMRNRCLNPKCKNYKHYGGRGITICAQWVESFPAFLEDMGERPTGRFTLERKNNSGNYAPENCKWATFQEQSRNTRQNRIIKFHGRAMCMQDWAKELGLTWPGIQYRLKTWPLERALTEKPSR